MGGMSRSEPSFDEVSALSPPWQLRGDAPRPARFAEGATRDRASPERRTLSAVLHTASITTQLAR
jgi:hypothetical protein